MLLLLFFQILWSGKPFLHECYICNIVTYVTLVVFGLYLRHYIMCGGGRIVWVCDSGEMVDLRLLLEPYFVRCRVQKFFSRRGSVLASISKLKKNNFETIWDRETDWDHKKQKPHDMVLRKDTNDTLFAHNFNLLSYLSGVIIPENRIWLLQ